ncbi:MAG: DEAD/DEAH box helicase [Gammaproteobacteria bacterium]|uniref:ATP-dependent RNA helicase DeaD n=1 Tax=Candidatus Thiopontia autotrophica TaxID=2841688 RepID=A0A8J6TSU0_9GAMM|nr:DEAD/DEAH box helicase [Candidatus Thiopontia autotrophica]
MTFKTKELPAFDALGISPAVLKAITEIGYESPSPIQAEAIPPLLEGRDILGQAQTGTGKTAAFALPLLSRIDLKLRKPQVLVLAPTRELAIQVSEAFQRYAQQLKGFHVVPIYGGQDYRQQLRALDRGVHVVVGTPGRVMDHMRRGSLKLNSLQCLVLDEADEMLRMGFIDDVEWVLEQLPENHQTALFSATMPNAISRIAKKYLKDPALVSIKGKTTTVESVRQRYWMVSGLHKMDALTRILEVEETDGIIIFVRTKIITTEIAEKLSARGFAAEAINGDIPQKLREQTINKLKSGKLDILVATDVAARGLDVPRISHVINYDVSYDTESYVHRIGRTGRAGRKGDAILFIAPREKRMLHAIERATRQKIEQMDLPSNEVINDRRIAKFKQRITDTIAKEEDLEFYGKIIESYRIEHDIPALEIAAALANMFQGDTPLLVKNQERKRRNEKSRHEGRSRERADSRVERGKKQRRESSRREPLQAGRERFRLAVGSAHEVKADNIVGAIANVAGLFNEDIGKVEIHEQYSTVDLPEGMPRDIFRELRKTWVCGQKLEISRIGGEDSGNQPPRKRRGDKTGGKKKQQGAKRRGRPSKGRSKKGQPGS